MKTKRTGKVTCYSCGASLPVHLTHVSNVINWRTKGEPDTRKVDICNSRTACGKRRSRLLAEREQVRLFAMSGGRPGTVGWLISCLKKFPYDMDVVIGSTCGSYYDIDKLVKERIVDGEIVDDPDTSKAVCIEIIY